MSYNVISPSELSLEQSSFYLEGVLFAANLATEPTVPESWITPLFGDIDTGVTQRVTEQLQKQYSYIKGQQYSLESLLVEPSDLAEFAEGFLDNWQQISTQWQDKALNDGTARMLQAWLMTMMLAQDEAQTQAMLQEQGVEPVPCLQDYRDKLDLMANELAFAADEFVQGHQSNSVNPFKKVGRNDSCPCESGKKFKHCCGN